MFWVIVAPLYFVLAAVAPSILGLFVNRARPNFRTLSLSLRAVFVVIALICLAATSYVHVDSDEIAVLNKIYGTSSGIDRLDQPAQRQPRNHALHLGQKCRPPRRLGVALKPHRRQRQLLRRPNLCAPIHPAAHYITITSRPCAEVP